MKGKRFFSFLLFIFILFCKNKLGDKMLYRLDDDLENVGFEDFSNNFLYLGYVNYNELLDNYKTLGFSKHTVEMCKEESSFFSCDIEGFDDYSFVKINVVSAKSPKGNKNSLGVFIRKNLLLIVNIKEQDCSNRDMFLKLTSKISCQNITAEKLVCSFFETLVSGDNKELENVESKINRLEETVLKNNLDKDFNLKLLSLKKELLSLRGYYEQLIDISEALRENENEIFESESLKQFTIFTDKAVRLKENVDLLRDSVVHLWDAYQALMDVRLNRTMNVFALVTTVFFPITVVASWYGMNFEFMPELKWKYGYFYAIGLCVTVVTVFYLWIKKKKWF